MDDVLFASICEVCRLIKKKAISPAELLALTLERINGVGVDLNAFITVNRSAASGSASGPLHGIPVSIKDLILTRDLPTTAGSRVFGDGIRTQREAAVVRRLRQAGAVIVGKTNLHEFAYGVTNENSHFGPVRNPWDRRRISGGSSGGSGAAVAAGLCFASIGTDTRGSIRIPSAFCGITGLKPGRSLVPTSGVIPLSRTLDHVGPMTRYVEDAALLLQVLSGTTEDYLTCSLSSDLRLRVGVCEEYLQEMDAEVARVVSEAIETISDSGLPVEIVRFTHLRAALQASRIIASAEALAYHEEFVNNQPNDYDPRVLKRLRGGNDFTAVQYLGALRVRAAVRKEFRGVFRRIDCLLGATVPSPPPHIGQEFLDIGGKRVDIVENLVRFNAPQNVAGVPALVVPCGMTRQNLPVGLQIIGGLRQEAKVLQLGAHFQRITDWHLRRPPAIRNPS